MSVILRHLGWQFITAVTKTNTLCPHKNLYMNVYGSLIHNCQKLKSTQISLNRGTDKLCSYSRIVLSHKKEQNINTHDKDESQMHYAKWNRPDSIGYIYDFIYIIAWKMQNYRNNTGSTVCQRVVGRGGCWIWPQNVCMKEGFEKR